MRAQIVAVTFACALVLGATVPIVPQHGSARAQGAGTGLGEGKRIYQTANCVGCHKWYGGGGGGYGGDALSLRATHLNRDQIIETVNCGRPGTGMPYFHRGAYDDETHPCFGLSRQDLGKAMPVEAPVFLRPSEIAAVADYVLTEVKGKGEPTYAECIAFFSVGARVCNTYRAAEPAPSSPADGKGAASAPADRGG